MQHLLSSGLYPRKSAVITFDEDDCARQQQHACVDKKSLSSVILNKVKVFFSLIKIVSLLIITTCLLMTWRIYSLNKQREQAIFLEFAELLTNPSTIYQVREGSYYWYKEQLEKNNRLGYTKFKDPIMSRLGFQDTHTTSEQLFHYFRTFNTNEKCSKQHKCKIYADKTAGDYVKEGIPLDAVLHHCYYRPPFFLDSPSEEAETVNEFQHEIREPNRFLFQDFPSHFHDIDERYGEKMWRGMRRLSLLMCSEAMIISELEKLTLPLDSSKSSKSSSVPVNPEDKYSATTADISICFLSTCSVWVNYQYYQISLANSNKFGTKPFEKNKGICAFISNCNKGGTDLQERYEMLQTLSKYIPIKQFGKCGQNSQEGPGGKLFELENNCRFYFAAENSVIKEYVTEKFFEGIKAIENGAKMIMIYRGAPKLRESFGFPKSLFIDHSDFNTVDELGQFLKNLNDNDSAFEEYFNRITIQERKKADKALAGFEYRLGQNIPCRICKIIGQMKLARYLLFKIGFAPNNRPKISLLEWNLFKNQQFSEFSPERLKILDEIYYFAYQIFQTENNKQNEFNQAWKFD